MPSAGKKVTYGSRKKKGFLSKDSTPASPAPESRPLSPVPVTASPSPPLAPVELPDKADDVKDEWDASSAEEGINAASAPAVKDEWDAPSEDEESAPLPPSASKPTKTPAVLPVPSPSQPVKGAPPGPYMLSPYYVSILIRSL